MAISKFEKGSGVYKCRCCGINTRVTQDRSAASVELCYECYELAGMENEVHDGREMDAEFVAEVRRMQAIIAKKGGDLTHTFCHELPALPEGVTQQMVDEGAGPNPFI